MEITLFTCYDFSFITGYALFTGYALSFVTDYVLLLALRNQAIQ